MAIWIMGVMLFALLHTLVTAQPDLRKYWFLKAFDKKYHMFHVVVALVLTAGVQLSVINCSPKIAEWSWILYVFPPMLASEYDTTTGYTYSILATIIFLYLTENRQVNGLMNLTAFGFPDITGWITFGAKAFFIISLTAARHYSIRRHVIWVERGHLLQSVIQALSKTQFQSNLQKDNTAEWNWIAQEIAQRLKFDKVFILLLDEKGKEFNLAGGAGAEDGDLRKVHFSRSQGIAGHVSKTRAPHLAKRTGTSIRNGCSHYITFKGFDGTRSELAMPIMVNNKVLGILDIQSDRFDAFSKEDVIVASTLSASLSLRLEHKYELMARQEDTNLLAILRRTASAIHQQNNIKKIFDDLTQNLVELFQADLITLFPLAPGTNYPISPPYAYGEFRDPARLKVPLTDDSVTFDLIAEWEPRFFEDSANEPLLTSAIDQEGKTAAGLSKRFVFRENIASTAFLPIGTLKERVAVLFINYRRPFYFDDAYKLRLQALLSIYAVQLVITQQAELRNSPLFVDVPDLHSMFGIKLIDLISNFQETIKEQKGDVDQVMGILRKQLKEVIKEILKSKSAENEIGKDKYGLARLIENYGIALKHSSNRDLNIKISVDPGTFYSGRAVNQAIYATISEAMLNAVQYGEADTIEVEVKKSLTSIDVKIQDNGSGFNVGEATKIYEEERSNAWTGISGIFGRLEAIKRIFGSPLARIESNNQGTLIHVIVPLLVEVGNG
ncbi:MAG: GAF domain-containing protein [Chloroflexi bacterium]|nr:GAF domain-containing protein [Chloroflexota bacterium]